MVLQRWERLLTAADTGRFQPAPKLYSVFADTFGTKGQVGFEGGAKQRKVPQTRAKRVSAAPRQNQEGQWPC